MNCRSALAVCVLFCGLVARSACGCPFCSAVSRTFSEEIAAMDVVVTARLVQSPPGDSGQTPTPAAQPVNSTFQIVKVLKGGQWLADATTIATPYLGPPEIGQTYLIMGADPPDLIWSAPLPLSPRAEVYILRLPGLPEGPERLQFFLGHLQDKDEILTRDAYDEFARAPYADVCSLKQHLNHDQLVAWVKNVDIPAQPAATVSDPAGHLRDHR